MSGVTRAETNVDGAKGGDDEELRVENGAENGQAAAGTSHDGGNKDTQTENAKPGSTKEIARFRSGRQQTCSVCKRRNP